MISRLRRRHRAMSILAAIVAPAVFVVALLDRKPVEIESTPLTGQLGFGNPPAGDSQAREDVLLGDARIRIDTRTATDDQAPELWITVERPGPPVPPDVLVYWQPVSADAGLSNSARLLAPLDARAPQRLRLPREAAAGEIVFFSLAHNGIVARSRRQPEP
ncbi:MAG: hypothetical protein AAF610_04030 [Pseudomonadota bacterium]